MKTIFYLVWGGVQVQRVQFLTLAWVLCCLTVAIAADEGGAGASKDERFCFVKVTALFDSSDFLFDPNPYSGEALDNFKAELERESKFYPEAFQRAQKQFREKYGTKYPFPLTQPQRRRVVVLASGKTEEDARKALEKISRGNKSTPDKSHKSSHSIDFVSGGKVVASFDLPSEQERKKEERVNFAKACFDSSLKQLVAQEAKAGVKQ